MREITLCNALFLYSVSDIAPNMTHADLKHQKPDIMVVLHLMQNSYHRHAIEIVMHIILITN